jgi:hypothetical protein
VIAAGDPSFTQTILAVIGGGGLLTGVIALVRLPGDSRQQAVAASGNAVSALDTALEEVKESRDWWKSEAESARGAAESARSALSTCEEKCRLLEGELDALRAKG